MEVRMDSSNYSDHTWTAWPVSWSAVWIGMLAAIATGLVIGLAGVALGAQTSQADMAAGRMGMGALIFAVIGAFFSFAVGGWVATRVAGIWRAETATLHGGIVWLVAVPVLLVLAALGAGGFFGAWSSGLAGHPSWAQPVANVDPRDVRNSALGGITTLLLGLMGSVLGAWLGSEMNEAAHREHVHPMSTTTTTTTASPRM